MVNSSAKVVSFRKNILSVYEYLAMLHTQRKQQQQWEMSIGWALQHTFKEEIKMCSSKTFHLTPVLNAAQSPFINTAHYWFLRPQFYKVSGNKANLLQVSIAVAAETEVTEKFDIPTVPSFSHGPGVVT